MESAILKMDLGIIGGRIYMDGTFIDGNLYVQDGKIACITTSALACENVYDAAGSIVLPGLIDPHVHFHLGVGDRVNADDFHSGSIKGALGGITTYIDFLDPVKTAASVQKAFEERMKLAAESITDYAFHATIANPVDAPEVMASAFAACGISSVKVFTTYADTDRRTFDRYIYALLETSSNTGIQVVVHAENDDLILHGPQIPVRQHEAARPVISERTAVLNLAEMAEATGGNLYIVHVSAGSTVEAVRARYGQALAEKRIRLESCPHYFTLNSALYETERGWFYTMTPPLRPENERKALNAALCGIETLATDHCPYTPDVKQKPYTADIAMGIGGIEYAFRIMYARFGTQVIDHYTKNPAQAFGLYPKKGSLTPGADADIVIFDAHAASLVDDADSVYDGMPLGGAFKRVYSRGRLLVADGVLEKDLAAQSGRYLYRTL